MSSRFLFCFCTLLCSFGSSATYADAPNATNSPSKAPLPQLHVIAGKDDKAQGNQGMFEFGTLSMVDPSDDLEGLDSRTLWKGLPLPGLKHVFTLQNQTKSAVVITGFEHQWLVLNAQLWQNGENVPVPFRLQPNQKIGVQVALNYRMAGVANNAAWLVDVLGTDKKTPLATLAMAGSVESGIAFSVKELDFGRISKGSSPTKTFSIRFDKRVSDNIPPGPLKLLCKNPQIRILDAPSQIAVKGVKVEKDIIIFPMTATTWPQDLILNFRVELSPELPLGKFDENIMLRVEGAPDFRLVRDVILPVRGIVAPEDPPIKKVAP